MLGGLAPLLLLAPSTAAAFTVINNTDFPTNCEGKAAYSHGTSALDCAAQVRSWANCSLCLYLAVFPV
jgi:hypothetical protein